MIFGKQHGVSGEPERKYQRVFSKGVLLGFAL